jgi:hypothetical protein
MILTTSDLYRTVDENSPDVCYETASSDTRYPFCPGRHGPSGQGHAGALMTSSP